MNLSAALKEFIATLDRKPELSLKEHIMHSKALDLLEDLSETETESPVSSAAS
jgi:hypothetical protein